MNHSSRALLFTLLPFPLLAHGFLLSSLYSPSNMLTTWLITSLILPMATARKRGHPNTPFYLWKCFLCCLSVLLEPSAAQGSRLTIAHLRLSGGSDIYQPLQLSRPFLVIGQISLSVVFMTCCLLWPLLNICLLVPDPHTNTEDSLQGWTSGQSPQDSASYSCKSLLDICFRCFSFQFYGSAVSSRVYKNTKSMSKWHGRKQNRAVLFCK